MVLLLDKKIAFLVEQMDIEGIKKIAEIQRAVLQRIDAMRDEVSQLKRWTEYSTEFIFKTPQEKRKAFLRKFDEVSNQLTEMEKAIEN